MPRSVVYLRQAGSDLHVLLWATTERAKGTSLEMMNSLVCGEGVRSSKPAPELSAGAVVVQALKASTNRHVNAHVHFMGAFLVLCML